MIRGAVAVAETLRYPLTAPEPGKTCTGWIELDRYGIAGWEQSSGELDCVPAS